MIEFIQFFYKTFTKPITGSCLNWQNNIFFQSRDRETRIWGWGDSQY